MTADCSYGEPNEPQNRTERRAAAGRANVEKRWAKHRQARIDAGLPPTREMEQGRKQRFFEDPEEEAYWLGILTEKGLHIGASRTTRRIQAKRYAEAEAREIARAAQQPSTAPATDEDVLLSYWEAEAQRWRVRAERDAAMAAAHLDQARQAEQEIAYLVLARQKRANS